MNGCLGPLLTKREWARIRDRLSRCTHIVQWLSAAVVDLHRAGHLHMVDANFLLEKLEKLRGANDFGLSSMPYPYIFTIVVLTKLFLLTRTIAAAFDIAIFYSAYRYFGGDDVDYLPASEFGTLMAVVTVDMAIVSWVYQALLDLYTLLKRPNQGILAGHMPVPTFLQFTESVSIASAKRGRSAPSASGEQR